LAQKAAMLDGSSGDSHTLYFYVMSSTALL